MEAKSREERITWKSLEKKILESIVPISDILDSSAIHVKSQAVALFS